MEKAHDQKEQHHIMLACKIVPPLGPGRHARQPIRLSFVPPKVHKVGKVPYQLANLPYLNLTEQDWLDATALGVNLLFFSFFFIPLGSKSYEVLAAITKRKYLLSFGVRLVLFLGVRFCSYVIRRICSPKERCTSTYIESDLV